MKFRPSFVLLAVDHIPQREAGECLAACVAMALDYIGVSFDYKRLVRLLRIRASAGAPFSNVRELAKQNISVIYKQGTLEELYGHLASGRPCIASVQTRELPHWNNISSLHAIVGIGMDQEYIYLNDPELTFAPIKVSLGDFDLAWLEQDEFYAVLS
jgi:ABC-type bacteriocin/lantibiotic exporter with double-glycine peptidase domain